MRNLLPRNELIHLLSETVPALQELTADLDAAMWHFKPAPGEWSVTEIVCHLRDVDLEVHLPRLCSLINEEEPFMPGVVSDAWATERDYQSQDGPGALRRLAAARSELLVLIPPADDLTWERRGRHTFFGPTTFWELVCLVLEHDELHIEQIRETIASYQSRGTEIEAF
jgi:hypothetical protein